MYGMGMYDYEHDQQYSSPKNNREKKITVKMNLNSTHMCVIKYTRNEISKLSMFKKKINSVLNLGMQNYQDIRCFNLEGQELCEEDFEFLKNDEVIYCSRGEQFDHSTYYSDYEITKTIGSGGFGKVVLGIHKQNGEKVAIKVTRPEALNNADDVDMVFAEAETQKQLTHENIVKIHNCFMIKQSMQAFFIMEYLEGGEQQDYVEEKKRLPESEVLNYFLQIISAIDYCHRQKIIHRDLKLENVQKVSKTCDKIKIRVEVKKKDH